MSNLFKIAAKNLLRYKRRTLLTLGLIAMGVVFVSVFIAVTGSFKTMMIGQITDSFLGHIQIHRKGYLASIDTLPLTLNLKPPAVEKAEHALQETAGVEAYSPRIKFGGMFSNFVETSNIRLNGVFPDKEMRTVPLLPSRIKQGEKTLERGGIFVPELLARGLKVKVGDTVVVVATNADGSVNGKQFIVSAIIESATGPGGRDGYIHIEDAMEVLRMERMEIAEIAVRVKDFDRLHEASDSLQRALSQEKNKAGKPVFEVHTWEKLSPFYNIARMIDVMTFFIKLMLIAVVLTSIMNVMIMAVYERVREIGTMAAIGTLPGKILSLFLVEGCVLGVLGAVCGSLIGGAVIYAVNLSKITFDFGRQQGMILSVDIGAVDMLTLSGIVVFISMLASLQPAFKASRMDPIKALGYV